MTTLVPSDNYHYVKTYTAGEDEGRLAKAAKELGLKQARIVRQQVRERTPDVKINTSNWWNYVLDTSVEESRMFAIYSVRNNMKDREISTYDSFLNQLEESFYYNSSAPEEKKETEENLISDPHHHDVGGSIPAAVIGIIKAMVGPAILYLPHGFASAGYITALPCMFLTTILFLYSAGCLLETWKVESTKFRESFKNSTSEQTSLLEGAQPQQPQLQRKNSKTVAHRHTLSYPELAYRAFGKRGETLVKTGIALMQSGVCLTYLIFVPQNLHSSLLELFHVNISAHKCLVIMLITQIPLSWIRDIRKLTPTNMLANMLILYGLTTCIGLALKTSFFNPIDMVSTEEGDPATILRIPDNTIDNFWLHVQTSLSPFEKDWFLFIGTSVLLFEGTITLLVPLQEAIQGEEAQNIFPKVFQKVILSIISFYAVFGFINWIAFGHSVRTVLTTSLPPGILATSVQLAYSLAVIFTFPLQNFPALEIVTRSIQTKLGKNFPSRNVISSVTVVLLGVVALLTMDSLDKVVSLMGGLLGCPIAFCFPPMIHLKLVLEKDSIMDDSVKFRRKCCNCIVIGLGIIAMMIATITTLMSWSIAKE